MMKSAFYFISFLRYLHFCKKQVVSTLFLIYFGRHRLGHTIKANFMTIQFVDSDMLNFEFLSGTGYVTSFSTTFRAWYFKESISHAIFYQLTKFDSGCLYFLRYWPICALSVCIVIIYCAVCGVISFEINHSFLIKPFFYITVKSG